MCYSQDAPPSKKVKKDEIAVVGHYKSGKKRLTMKVAKKQPNMVYD